MNNTNVFSNGDIKIINIKKITEPVVEKNLDIIFRKINVNVLLY